MQNRRFNLHQWGVTFALFFLFSGCQTARMEIGNGLRERAEEWPVEGRQRIGFREQIMFGPYRVTDIQRGRARSRTLGSEEYRSAQVRSAQARQRFEFRIENAEGQILDAHCATDVRWQDIRGPVGGGTGSIDLDTETVFACTFDREAEPTWFLAMRQGTADVVLNGALVRDARTIIVQGVQKLEGTSMPLLSPAGYTFHENERIVAAVEVINRGAVWFAPDLDPDVRDPIAASAAALMLYRELK